MSKSEREFRSSHTTDKETYIKSWNNHIEELISIGYPLMRAGDGLFDELTRIQDRLEELVKIAADKDFS